MEKQIILLNGPSSSGKSTLSKALQGLIEEKRNEKFVIVSIDDFMKLSTEETIYEDDVFEISGDMCTSALEALKTSSGVIIDHVITSERIFRQLTAMLGQYHIHSVHVTCPLNVLLQREYARKNRCLGSAESSYTYLFPKDEYDLTVDTSIMTPAECSAKIYGALL
jgi:chloramphenicol 3-O phosphotransferase